MQPGPAERPFDGQADPAGVRRQTIGTMLILVGVLFSLAGTGLAASAYLRAVDDPGASGNLMTTSLGTQAPLQLLIGTGVAVVGAVSLFFGLVLRSVDDLRVPSFEFVTGRSLRRARRDPARERNVRWSAMAALSGLFIVSILSAVALSPDAILTGESELAVGSADEPLYEDTWQGSAATDPAAHLQERLSPDSGAVWRVPVGAMVASVNLTWTPVDDEAELLRLVVQEDQDGEWVTVQSLEGASSLVVDVPVEGREQVRFVVERATSDETEQPFVLHVSFWAE